MIWAILAMAAVGASGCGPSEQEFEAACLESTMRQRDCDESFSSDDDSILRVYCAAAWDRVQGQSADCLWYFIYYYDCVAGTSCDALGSPGVCAESESAIMVYCTDGVHP